MNQRWSYVLAALIVALVFLPGTGFAQQTASIRGTVQDGSGAVIGGAEVQATNSDTGQTLQTVTTLSGIYLLGNVPVGNYSVEATLEGFKRFVRDSVSVNTATTTNVDVVLEIGDVTESVTIEGTAAPLLRTDNAELSTVMERKLMIDLPLGLSGKSTGAGASGRREIGQFTFLTPGVSGGRGWNRHILGAPQFTGQDIIDGVPFTLLESPGLTDRMGPPFESVQEFKVSTTMYPANLGRGVGITNYTLRSGTNQFHGNAFWFFRNDQLDASGFFNPTRPIVRQNEYGGNIGGPIRKRKTFFHFSWQGFKRRGGSGALGLLTIPTTEFRRGDFSQLTDPGGNLLPIFDGASTRPDGAGSFVRDPFSDNTIPATRIDPIADRVMGMLPQPDGAGIVDNWVNRSSNPTDDDSFALKFDHELGENHRLSGSWWYSNLRIFRYSAWGDHPLDTGIRTPTQTWSLRVNYDWVVTPTFLNHLSWGYSNFRIPRTGNVVHEGNVLGVPGLPDDIVVLPSFRPAGYLGMGNSVPVRNSGSIRQPSFRIQPLGARAATRSCSVARSGCKTTRAGLTPGKRADSTSERPPAASPTRPTSVAGAMVSPACCRGTSSKGFDSSGRSPAYTKATTSLGTWKTRSKLPPSSRRAWDFGTKSRGRCERAGTSCPPWTCASRIQRPGASPALTCSGTTRLCLPST